MESKTPVWNILQVNRFIVTGDNIMIWPERGILKRQGWAKVHHNVKHMIVPKILLHGLGMGDGKYSSFANDGILFLFTFYTAVTFLESGL